MEFSLADVCTLKITTYTNRVSKLIHIHNVYNLFSLSYVWGSYLLAMPIAV